MPAWFDKGRLVIAVLLVVAYYSHAQKLEHPYSNRAAGLTNEANTTGAYLKKRDDTRNQKRQGNKYPRGSKSRIETQNRPGSSGVLPSNRRFQTSGRETGGRNLGVNPSDKFRAPTQWINKRSLGEDPSSKFLFTPEMRGLNVTGVDPNAKFRVNSQWINNRGLGEDPKDKYFGRYGSYTGTLDLKAYKRAKDFKSRDKAGYSGDMDLGDYRKMKDFKSRDHASYSGDWNLSAFKKSKDFRSRDHASYSGDWDLSAYKKQKDFKSKDLYAYSGDLSMREIRKRERKVKAIAKEMAGLGKTEIIVVSKGKNMHPSIAAKGAKVRTQAQTKRYRWRKRLWNKWWKWNDLPPSEKKNEKKPSYDSKEAAIWN
jgi:hypothetical protein